jgi:hypothetical protein
VIPVISAFFMAALKKIAISSIILRSPTGVASGNPIESAPLSRL